MSAVLRAAGQAVRSARSRLQTASDGKPGNSCGLGVPIPPDGKMPSEAGCGKILNTRTPYPELVCTLLWTSGLVF
ncbi:hypothetical protein [Neisseria benedictiae]|uniref:hypothetical protein n=1 Tax=Neisseria benedictiae TaxID=2830649 RepID=UPI0026582686|nr:hypothetical protein [Neisseria benedictiae]